MKIRVLAVGHKMPAWVEAAYTDYQKRLGSSIQNELVEISPARRSKTYSDSVALQYKAEEGERILAQLKPREQLVCLEVTGKALSTEQLAQRMANWMQDGDDIALVIGGADGICQSVLAGASAKVSLSKLTLPHQLARVVLIEQLYRAGSILANHPYHRG